MAKCLADSTLGSAPDTYLYTLARHGDTFATIGSDDSLRLFDISLKVLKKVQPAQSGISCLSRHENGFATAGRDGVIQLWDVRAQASNIQTSEPRSRGFSSITCHDQNIAAGTESTKEGLGDVSVLFYDTRNLSVPVRNYTESHTDTITQLAFHPTQPNLLLSGSTDGLVSIFDVNVEDEDDALQRVLNPRSAVHCAGFLSPTEVYVATTDECLSIYSLAESDSPSAMEFGDVREKVDCMYIIDIVNGPQPAMAYGHNFNQTLSIVELDVSRLYSFGAKINLPGAHGEEVVRDLMILGKEKKAMSCGEDGQVKVWELASGLSPAQNEMSVD